MMFPNETNHTQERVVVEDRTKITYGHIVDILMTQDEKDNNSPPGRYIPIIAKEGFFGPASENVVPMRIAQTPQYLAANYGSPEDLIGYRVKIEYTGSSWIYGVCTIVDNGQPDEIGEALSVEGERFLFARAGAVE